jgi:DNA-binding transcriptional LysR family regulator
VVANHRGFTSAAREFNLTKDAVSYQISRLEDDLGFTVFTRNKQGVALTEKGLRLLQTSHIAFKDIESEIKTYVRMTQVISPLVCQLILPRAGYHLD